LSAGFDAHIDDPLADCTVSDAGFEAMARAIREIADRFAVPVGLLLEGGYNVDALARSLALTMLQLRGVQGQPTSFGDAPAVALELAEAVLSRPVFNEQL
jgi:acetoin utilization deacetylase AcuC-like enzyme